MSRKILLGCGIASSLFYIAINIFVPILFEGYDASSQTVSELSAIDAPTRKLWILLAIAYIVLFLLFGLGILQSAGSNRRLRTVAYLIFIYVIINLYWPPMHLRGNEPTLTDALHITWAVITIVLMMLIMGFGAAAIGKTFRNFTIITFLVFIAFGILIAIESPGIPKNLSTPSIGIWERINIAAYMVWVIVFAIVLLQKDKTERFAKIETKLSQ